MIHSHATTQANAAPPSFAHQPELDARQLQFLQQQGFSSGLIQAFAQQRSAFPLRIWVLDNGASMNVADAHRITAGTFHNSVQSAPVTRWQELQDCVAYHSQMAATLYLPTRYAFLNDLGAGPQYFALAHRGPQAVAQEMHTIQEVVTRTRPAGPTPLTAQVAGLRRYVASIAPRLISQRQTVTVVLATQGLPTDQGFVPTLRSLEGLPVWVIVRLCTDDERVFDFYNSLDAQLNLPYDVLDDFFGESLEVYLRNPWLTYALPLHRFRELGFRSDVLDAIDERPLSVSQVGDLCRLLFSVPSLPDPTRDWNAFMYAITPLVQREVQHWNPVTRKTSAWINLHDLNRLYSRQAHIRPTSAPFPYSSYQQQPQQPYPQRPPNFPQHAAGPAQTPQSPQKSWQMPTQHVNPQPAPPHHTVSDPTALKQIVLLQWARANTQAPRPIHELLGTIQQTFPPSFGVPEHDYFHKWKPFSMQALASGQPSVLKRGKGLIRCFYKMTGTLRSHFLPTNVAIRKTKFFLHPDRLPKDFSELQLVLCRTLWDVVADASQQVG